MWKTSRQTLIKPFAMSKLIISNFTTYRGEQHTVELSYSCVGPEDAPVVLVCHALTGNSDVVGPNGWWARLIGPGEAIDSRCYRILAFDIPGNGYGGTPELDDPETFDLRDVARLFILGLERLGISHLYALLGASMGGAIAWQIAALRPHLAEHLFPVCTDYCASDWLLAQTLVQENILRSSPTPLHDARIHAMLTYRTPESIIARFGRRKVDGSNDCYASIDWLDYHGRALEERFLLSAYRVMTFLTRTIQVAESVEELRAITAEIHIVSVDSDLLFPHFRAKKTVLRLRAQGQSATFHTIHSIHGHDAFLMEYTQLSRIIAPYFSESTPDYGTSLHSEPHLLTADL